MRKVLLLNSPVITSGDGKVFDINPMPPIGMAYLSTALKKTGFEVKILDVVLEGWHNHKKIEKELYYVGLDYQEIKKIIFEYSPDFVGISAMFSRQAPIYKEVAKAIKEVSKDILIIMGGAHTTVDPESVLEDKNVDFILMGEADKTLPQLLMAIKNNDDYKDIDGIGYKENEKIVIKPKVTYITNLDDLGFPDWEEAKLEKYFGLEQSHGVRKKTRFAPIVTSRGCPYNCVFCSAKKVWGRQFRPRSPKNVVDELIWLKKQYNVEEVMMEDDNLTLDPKRAEKIFDLMIEKKLDLEWDTPNGIAVWTLNKELVKKMIQSGCQTINIAIESGNQHHLKHNIKKPVNLKKVEEIVKIIRRYDVYLGVYLVFGIPGETREMIFDSYRFVGKLGVYDPFISIATPYFGTELYEMCKNKGYLKKEVSSETFYIRSFSIETEELSKWDIKRMMIFGWVYLLVLKIRNRGLLTFLKRVLFLNK